MATERRSARGNTGGTQHYKSTTRIYYLPKRHIKDLDDLAEVMQLGLINQEKTAFILRHTQMLVRAMSENEFPYPELEAAMAADDELLAQARRLTDPGG